MWKLFQGIGHRNKIDSPKPIWIIWYLTPIYRDLDHLMFKWSNRHHSLFNYINCKFGSPYFSRQAFYQGLVDDHAYVKERRKVETASGFRSTGSLCCPLSIAVFKSHPFPTSLHKMRFYWLYNFHESQIVMVIRFLASSFFPALTKPLPSRSMRHLEQPYARHQYDSRYTYTQLWWPFLR